MNRMIQIIRLFLLSSLVLTVGSLCFDAKAQEFSVRTNLLWDAVSEPNIGLEFSVSDHWSVGANAGIKSWPRWLAWDWDKENPTHWRNFLVAPEVRYYFKQIYQGAFIGADAVGTYFNVGKVPTPFHMYPDVEESRLQGSYWAGGLFAGWAWWPWQHWRIELEAGAAVGMAAYSRYACAHCGTKLGDERKVGVVPKVGLNIAYNPVSRDESNRRRLARRHSGPADTVTLKVMTPPVAFVVNLQPVKGPVSEGDRLTKEQPWVLPISQYRPIEYRTQSAKDSLLYVQFRTSEDVLRQDLENNSQVLDRVQRAVESLRDDPSTDEILVTIVGLSSIEGAQVKNDTLSMRRARALAAELRRRTGIGPRSFEVVGKGEAWDWFREQVEASPEGFTDAELRKLQGILDSQQDADARERMIRSDAALYAKVSQLLLGSQRNAGYIRVYYGNKPDPSAEKLNGPVYDLLQARKYHKAVKEIKADASLLSLVSQDPEAANAYGIALYFVALDNKDESAEKEAISLLEKAAAEGSSAAVQNLKGIETYGPARKEYEAWKELMNQ